MSKQQSSNQQQSSSQQQQPVTSYNVAQAIKESQELITKEIDALKGEYAALEAELAKYQKGGK